MEVEDVTRDDGPPPTVKQVRKVDNGVTGRLVRTEAGHFQLQEISRPTDAPATDVRPTHVASEEIGREFLSERSDEFQPGLVVDVVD